MKIHLKAFLITAVVFLGLISFYFFMTKGEREIEKKKETMEAQLVIPENGLVLLNGTSFSFKDKTDKIIIFNFWASWCAPCIEEVPSLISLVKADPNIVIVAVSGDQNKDDIAAFLKSFPAFNQPPIYVVQENAKALMEHFKVDKLPESFIFNTKGEMVKKISGTINWHTPESIEYFKVIRAK